MNEKNLDWYQIEFLYPKGFQHFTNKMFPNSGLVSVSSLKYFDLKQLYLFFDREGIFLNTEIVGSDQQWSYTLHFSNGTTISYPNSYTCREDVEVEGFQKCFSYLENILI